MTIEETIAYGNMLLHKYNLKPKWSISIETHTNKRFGLCEYFYKTIYISKFHIQLNTDFEIKRTVIHEVAHALTNCGHSPVWKAKFEAMLNIELDCNERVTTRFGKGKVPTAAEIKKRNNFTLDL